MANEGISGNSSQRCKAFPQSGQRQACLPMCPRLSISRKSPRVNGLTGSKSTFKKDTKRQGIYPRANNFVENGNELSLKKQTKFSLKAFFLEKKKTGHFFLRAILSWHFHSKYFSILSPGHVFASVQLHSAFKKKIVPTQPNNSSSI